MERRVVASAPGKVVLLGEYAVLESGPALVMAVPVRAMAKARVTGDARFTLDARDLALRERRFLLDRAGPLWEPRLGRSETQALRVLGAVLADIGRRARDELPPFAVETDARAFVSPTGAKLGLGSSAAVAVASWAALWALTSGQPPAAEAVLEAVFEVHRAAQGGVGSGVDVAASCLGGVLEYRQERRERGLAPTWRRTVLPDRLHVVAIHTGTAASTPELVGRVRGLARRDADAYRDFMTGLAELAQGGCVAAANGDVAGLLAASRAYAQRMAELGRGSGADIFSAAHRRVQTLVERWGAVYKPSGAGGGDLGLALTDEGSVAARVRAAAAAEGLLAMDLVPEPRGVEVELSGGCGGREA